MTSFRIAVRTIAAASLLVLGSCGGPTGLNIRIEPPSAFPAGDAFDSIKVEVSNRAQESFSEPPFIVTPATPQPYRVYVWLGEEPQPVVTIDVKLIKAGQTVKQKRCPNITFDQGKMKEIAVDLGSNDDCLVN